VILRGRHDETSDAQKGEMRNMCEILDKIENRGIAKGIEEGMAKGRAEGIAEGIEKGNTEGKSQMADLMKILLTENRIEDAKRAAEDLAYCDELMKQYGIG
jgi:flagellar biosynthesis/type III secretory pathway protein FliH